MTHIPDHLQGDSPLARWWVALESVRREMAREAKEGRFYWSLYTVEEALATIEYEAREEECQSCGTDHAIPDPPPSHADPSLTTYREGS